MIRSEAYRPKPCTGATTADEGEDTIALDCLLAGEGSDASGHTGNARRA